MQRLLIATILALVFTLLNAIKPLHIDDAAYYYFARNIAERPQDPYDFQIFWYQRPDPANQVLAPPVLLYWWALAIRLFGHNPIAWKLWLFPFSWLFVQALADLYRRFAASLEWPLVFATVFSPIFLPSLNLMLDIPALALSLTALNLLLRSATLTNRPVALALICGAGLLSGLAMETKYTAFLMPPLMFLAVLLPRDWTGRTRLLLGALLAAALAGLLFLGCEAWLRSRLGESHFLANLGQGASSMDSRMRNLAALLSVVGGVGIPIAILGLVALRPRGWVLAVGTGIGLLGYGLVAVLRSPPGQSISLMAYLAEGWLLVCVLIGVIGMLFWKEASDWRSVAFLLAWLLLEIVGCFFLTPFPAVRRIMGVAIVGSLLAARLASLTCVDKRRRLIFGVAGVSVALGLAFYAIDLSDAYAQQQAARSAKQWIRAQSAEGQIWFVGHWGFQHYAEEAGMTPVIPDQTRLAAGDWLVVPEDRIHKQELFIDPRYTRLEMVLILPAGIPLSTTYYFYGGGIPLERLDGPRLTVFVYRVTEEHPTRSTE